MQKIGILTSTPPNSNGVGEIFLSNIADNCQVNFQARISIVKRSGLSHQKFWNGANSSVIEVDKKSLPIISDLYLLWFIVFKLEDLVEEIAMMLKNNNIDILWVTLSSPELILVVQRLQSVMQVRLYSTIWDLPEYFLKNSRLNSRLAATVQDAFVRTLQKSEKISCISSGMARHLGRYLVSKDKIHIIRNGIAQQDDRTVKALMPERQKIFFVGSLYAKAEWNALVRALESVNFRISDKNIDLVHIGQFPRTGAKRNINIAFLGYLPNEEILRMINSSDIGYVPYWLDSDKKSIVETSFPGKVSTYIMSGCKVFFHGPKKSTVADFLSNYSVGICCASHDTSDIVNSLSNLIYMEIDQVALKEAKYTLSIDKMAADFMRFVS